MFDPANFPTFNFPLDTVVQLVFYAIVGLYAIFTAIFYFHWQQYATDTKVTNLTLGIYVASTLPLIAIMGIMVLLI